MASRRTDKPTSSRRKGAPPSTPEGRENYFISLAEDLAEQQLSDGSASAQVITHFLKLGTERDKLEREKLRRENVLLEAKVEQIEAAEKLLGLYEEAISAMREYGPAPTRSLDNPEGNDGSFVL